MTPATAPFVAAPVGDLAIATAAASAAAAHWHLAPPQLVRHGMNALFAAGDGVVLRACRPTVAADALVWLGEWLTARGVRVPRAERAQAFEWHGVSVVAQAREHPVGTIDWEAVGAMVAELHATPPAAIAEVSARFPTPPCSAFPWWHFDAVLADVGGDLDADARRGIERAVSRCDWGTWLASPVLCHGDVHPGNVIPTLAGPVLIDWDLLCLGPPAWDHAALMTWTDRWGGEPNLYERFAAGYGRSMRGDEVAEAIAELRLVAATLMRVRAGRTDRAAAAEAERRLRYWRGDPDAPVWRAA
ncbi:MAG: aminoglycoside phosphotransferase family protein [Acidimicrobiales bacterium]|nr:aminoglycoside phosphotransferase family protein [Acidimicrobiales bacterium]MCB9394524.1 aminoglycoside phosphotransferase family protein [Acidimicrobiaceae bacterium]